MIPTVIIMAGMLLIVSPYIQWNSDDSAVVGVSRALRTIFPIRSDTPQDMMADIERII